jgi:hypothetical protein
MCETNPIPSGGEVVQVISEAVVTDDSSPGRIEKTNPIQTPTTKVGCHGKMR